jgi:hypothetical protein
MNKLGVTPAPGALGETLPAWHLRAALTVAVALSCLTIAAWTTPPSLILFALVAMGAASVVWPQTHAPGISFAVAALCVLIDTGAGIAGWTFGAVFTLHATHLLAALCALSPRWARIEHAALRPSLLRFAGVQVACQPLVALAWFLT